MATLRVLVVVFLFSLTMFADADTTIVSEKKNESLKFSLSSEFYSNLKNASSSESQRFMFATLGMRHSLIGKWGLSHSFRFDKNLENFRENGFYDYRLSFTGLKSKIDERLSLSWTPRVDFVFDELRSKNFAQRGSVRLTQNAAFKVIPSFLNLNILLSGIKNIHKFKTNFDGGSNASFVFNLGVNPIFSLTDSLSFSIANFWLLPYTYEGKAKRALSAFDATLSYQANKNLNLSAGISTTSRILNDLGVTKDIGNYFVNDQTLLVLGGSYSF